MVQESWKATIAAIEEQQSALGSLAKVVLQNRRTINVITAEAVGVSALLNETCCSYINTSGQVEEDLHILKKNIKLIEDLKERAEKKIKKIKNKRESRRGPQLAFQPPLL